MSGAAALALALVAAALLAGCSGAQQQAAERKLPESLTTPAAGEVLQNALVLTAVKAALVAHEPDAMTAVGVSVSGGAVTLRGVVKDAGTRSRLIALARETAHVRSVDADALRVDPHHQKIEDRVGDVALTTRIQAAIDAQVGIQHVGVRVDRGVATLDGSVADARTKATVLRTARDTSGVRNVVDRIRVAGP